MGGGSCIRVQLLAASGVGRGDTLRPVPSICCCTNPPPSVPIVFPSGKDVDEEDADKYTSRDDDVTDDEGGVLPMESDSDEGATTSPPPPPSSLPTSPPLPPLQSRPCHHHPPYFHHHLHHYQGEPLSMGRTVEVVAQNGTHPTTYTWKRVPAIVKDERGSLERFDLQVNSPPHLCLSSSITLFVFVCIPSVAQPRHQQQDQRGRPVLDVDAYGHGCIAIHHQMQRRYRVHFFCLPFFVFVLDPFCLMFVLTRGG